MKRLSLRKNRLTFAKTCGEFNDHATRIIYGNIHPKLCNINLHNVTLSSIPKLVIQISLLIVTLLSLISQILSLMQTTQEVNPHPRIAPCVNMWSVTFLFLFLFFLCHLLNVGACVWHIAQEGQVEWTTPAYVTGKQIQIVLTSPLCYSIMSRATMIL
jgi:hypothetical protein